MHHKPIPQDLSWLKSACKWEAVLRGVLLKVLSLHTHALLLQGCKRISNASLS